MLYKEISERSHYAVALFFFISLFLIYFSPVIFSGGAFPADGYLADFHSPLELWTNYFYSGYPIYAAPDKQYAYPIRLVFTFFPNIVGFNLFIVSAYVLTSIFTYGYVYHLTNSKFSAYASAIVFGLCGFMVAHLIHTSMIHAAAWMPLVLWALSRLRQEITSYWLCIGSVAVAMSILAGHPQITTYTLLVAALYVLFMGRSASFGWVKYYLLSLLVVILGFALAAFQLIPMLELTELSLRQRMTYEMFTSYTLPVSQISQLFFAFMFGGVKGVAYSGKFNFHELTGYFGFLTMFLALIGVIVNKKNGIVVFWSLVALFSLLISLGDATPLFQLFYEIPVINMFRAHARIFVIMSFALAVLTGFGIHALQSGRVSGRLRRNTLIITPVIIVLLLVPTWLFSAGMSQLPLVVIVPLAFLLLAMVVVMYWNKPIISTNGRLLILSVLLLDLGVTSSFFAWKYDITEPSFMKPSDFHAKYKTQLDYSHQRFAALDGYWSNTLSPDQARLYEIQSVGGYEQLELRRYNLLSGVDRNGRTDRNTLLPGDRSWDILSVKYISSNKPINTYAGELESVQEKGGIYIYRNPNVLPRAWLVSKGYSLDMHSISETIRTSLLPNGEVFNPGDTALVEGIASFKLPRSSKSSVDIVNLNNQEIKIRTEATESTFLILSDIYYPGWKVFVDGVESNIIQTNLSLRGVFLPPGRHLIEFEFHPKSLYWGVCISLSAILLLFVFVFVFVFVNKKYRLKLDV